ncbi:MAG: efflux RND transporter permease subunit [Bacteroidales bacterium]|nr:efflux RND transporter permease subunit [Bacteroidales bacterium]
MLPKKPNTSLLPSYINSFTVIAIFVLLVIAGIATAPRLSIRLYPSTQGKSIYVSYSYSGATAEAVEMEVTAPIEGFLSLVEGVEKISSVSGDGWGRITINLTRDVKPAIIRFKVLSLIREIYPRLPQGVTYPRVSSQSLDNEKMVQLLTYTIASDLNPPSLRELANELIVGPISLIEGVTSVNVYGANTNDWYIEYNPETLERHSISTNDIAQAVSLYGFTAGIGVEKTKNGETIPLVITGPGIDPRQWQSIEVANRNGRIITLGQVATIEQRERKPDGYFRINGQTAITLVIQASADANQISTANRVYSAINDIRENLPHGVELQKSQDNTIHLRADLRKNFLRTIFSISILLVFVLIASRSFRYLLIVGISLLANIAIAILFYHALNLDIHMYSLSGITLSLGLIIDNTLVMVDHLRHRRNMLVFTAILAATLTTIGALVSIFFMEESQRTNLTDFAWVIIVNLSVSLLIGLFLIPSLVEKIELKGLQKVRRNASLKFRYALSKKYTWLASKIYRFRKIVITIGILAVGIPIFALPDKIEDEGFWPDVYNKTFGSNTYRTHIKPIADKALGGSLRLFYNSVWTKGFWGTPERTRVFVRASLPQGSTLEQSDKLAAIFESHIMVHSEVEQSICNVRGTGFNIEIFFTPENENSSFPFQIKSKLESIAITQAGADFSIYGVGRGFSNAIGTGWANSQIVLTGYSHRQLMGWARIASDSLLKMPRVDKVWIRGGQAYWFTDEYRRFLTLDEQKLLTQGIHAYQMAAALSQFSPRSDRIQYETVNHKTSAIRIRPSRDAIPSNFEVKQTPLSIGQQEIRTQTVANFRDELTNDQIHKVNQEYIITLAYNYIGPDKLVQMVMEQQIEQISSMLPIGFKVSKPTYSYWNKEDKKQYALIGLMVLILFIITSVLFESMRQPIAVILLVPLSFIGVFTTYWMFDLSFDQGTYAAFILLGGLVVNSAIYIINEQNNLRKRYPNATALSIYKRAVNAKIIPVLLTVLSTVLGLLPFVMFGEDPFWFSLATGTIGGLIFSIPALLLFLPALPGGMHKRRNDE